MKKIIRQFRFNEVARQATNETFQQSNCPSVIVKEEKTFYSGKPHFYAFRLETSVFLNGLVIAQSKIIPGSEADIKMFRSNQARHVVEFLKCENEIDIKDNGDLYSSSKRIWDLLIKKWYIGVSSNAWAIFNHTRPVMDEWQQ